MLDNETQTLNRFANVFVMLDELICSHDQPPPRILYDGLDPEDWNFIRWKPAKLAVLRSGVEALRKGGQLPVLFEWFARSYAWLEVDLKICRLFANPPSDDLTTLASAMFADPVINNTLLQQQLVRFALASDSSYDPICFDLSKFDGKDCPIIRVEHESVLMRERVEKRMKLFDSFGELIEAVIAIGSR